MKKTVVCILILLVLQLVFIPMMAFADEDEIYDEYIRSAELFDTEIPTHFVFTFSEFAYTPQNTDALEDQSMEMRDGQMTEQTFHRITGVGYGNQGQTVEETITIRLRYIAAPYRLVGEYEREVIEQSYRPEITSPTHFHEQTETMTEISKGTITGGLDIGRKTIETGRLVFRDTENNRHFLLVENGEAKIDNPHEGPLTTRAINIRVDEVFSSMAPGEERVIDIVDTDAASEPGTMSTAVALAVVFAGGIAAIGAVGMGNYTKQPSDDKTSTYHMVIYKDFGDKIKYNSQPVFIYAKMNEINLEGTVIPRPDLSTKIEMFTNQKSLSVGNVTFTGEYMCASVSAYATNESDMEPEGIISFRFTGEGGIFQNNVSFQLVGEAYIRVEGSNLYALCGSGRSFNLLYELVDFMDESQVELEVKCMQINTPFALITGKAENGQPVIIATDDGKGTQAPIEKFYDSYTCEIIGKSEKESARTIFSVVMCHEALVPDFLGREREINAYPEEDGKLLETLVVYNLGLWNEESQSLSMIKPENMTIECKDKEGTFDAIGIEIQLNNDYHRNDAVQYKLTAQKALPALESVKGALRTSCSMNGVNFENEVQISLLPDSLKYEADFEEEYKNCIYTINTYLPDNFRDRKLNELKNSLPRLGLEDLRLFRKNCWKMAEIFIMQRKESYMIASYWYDEAIATAELLVYIGDIAFSVATAPMGGPIAGFLISNVKDSFIEMVEIYVKSSSFGFSEAQEFIKGRFVKLAGQADFVFSPPKRENQKQLVAWLVCFTLYRICYRWWFDKDDNHRPIGLTESVKRGLLDFAGKGIGVLMEDYVKNLAQESGWNLMDTEYISLSDADQELYDDLKKKGGDAVTVAVKYILDLYKSIELGS